MIPESSFFTSLKELRLNFEAKKEISEAYPALPLAPISEQDAKNAVESDKFTPNFSGVKDGNERNQVER